ncbi:MAG: SDR family NAD(P)-dependent oxidoreductase [Vulcanimicrobiaceae bacterium]
MILEDELVILAGATGSVGGAVLGTLLAQGAHVLVVSRRAASAEGVIAAATDGRPELAERCAAFEADLLDAAAGEAVALRARERLGRIDAVVSLAGGPTRFMPILESTVADLEVNVRNFLLLTYNLVVPALRAMLAQPFRSGKRSRGRLIVVTAGSSLDPQPRFGLMGAAKAGVNTLMLAIAREHKADGIVANALVLGGVATERARDYLGADDFAAAATPQEVADALVFLASDASSGVNGALVHLNAREVD